MHSVTHYSPTVELLHGISASRDEDADEVGKRGLPNSQVELVHDVRDEKFEIVDPVLCQPHRKRALIHRVSRCEADAWIYAPE